MGRCKRSPWASKQMSSVTVTNTQKKIEKVEMELLFLSRRGPSPLPFSQAKQQTFSPAGKKRAEKEKEEEEEGETNHGDNDSPLLLPPLSPTNGTGWAGLGWLLPYDNARNISLLFLTLALLLSPILRCVFSAI